MENIKTFETFLYDKNDRIDIYKTQKKKNEDILKMIYDMDLQYHEGEYNPKTWLRKAELLPTGNRNNEIITDFAGISLSFDTHTSEYKLSLPWKFKSSFEDEIEKMIVNNFNFISSTANDRNIRTRVIKFKE